MQCASCQFENMPTIERCVRCGATLGAALAGIDIYPPRARAWRKKLRGWFPLRRAYFAMRDGLPNWQPSSLVRGLLPAAVVSDLTPGLVLRMAVPGWAHFYLGQWSRGAIFAGLYFPLLLLGLLMLGTTAGAVALGLAFALHAASVIDLLVSDEDELSSRLFVTPAIALITVGALYGAIGAIGGRYLAPRRLMETIAPFSAGDVVIISPRAYESDPPKLGDVVLYRVPDDAARHRINNRGGAARIYQIAGERIDRVVAGPGSKVSWDGKSLQVDGQLSAFRPLNVQSLPAGLSFTVPNDHYAILLTTDTVLGPNVPSAIWNSVCIVPAENIQGRAVLRSYPWTRWWWID